MPWSDWQDPFEFPMSASVLQLFYRTGGGTALIGSDHLESSFTYFEGTYGWTVVGYQYKKPAGLETTRLFPYPMYDLTQGVDYIEIPDQPGKFYEYEGNNPNTFLGWDVPPLTLSVNNDPPAEREFQLRMELGTTYALNDSLVFDFDGGTAIGSWSGITPEGTVIATPNPGMAASFSLWPSVPQPFDFSAENAYQEYLPYIMPWARTLTPRFRYWKPDPVTKPPLRLRQRDDNLFLNAGRTRNRSSRQTTNRLRSYD